MKEKCELCNSGIEKTFLDKVLGTKIKLGSGENSKIVLVCPSCQKEHKGDLVKRLEEKI